MVKIVNLTPHDVVAFLSGLRQTFPPSGEVARIEMKYSWAGDVNGIPVFVSTPGKITGLPEEKPDTVYIVSAMVRSALSPRQDLISPKGLIRDESGNVIGCEGFEKNPADYSHNS